jgi:hypothetical protein
MEKVLRPASVGSSSRLLGVLFTSTWKYSFQKGNADVCDRRRDEKNPRGSPGRDDIQ